MVFDCKGKHIVYLSMNVCVYIFTVPEEPACSPPSHFSGKYILLHIINFILCNTLFIMHMIAMK